MEKETSLGGHPADITRAQPTEPVCDGHNWEVHAVMPEWRADKAINREIAIVHCTFCGIVRKTVISNL